jgi:membrane protease YdiL (CAAX protease family)
MGESDMRCEMKMKKYEFLPIILILIAELFLFCSRMASIAVHSINILIIIGVIILKKDVKLVQALSLVSLLRIVNTSMPIFFSLTIYWFASLYGIMFLPILLTIYNQQMSLREIGITFDRAYLLPFAFLIGFGFALIEYYILAPDALILSPTFDELFKLSIVMFLFIGLVEELIFRSLLLQRLEEKIGLVKGLLLASLIFGFMHSGYANYKEILFAGFAGLVLGFFFQRTKSLPFVVLAHGFNNLILFGVLPFLQYF